MSRFSSRAPRARFALLLLLTACGAPDEAPPDRSVAPAHRQEPISPPESAPPEPAEPEQEPGETEPTITGPSPPTSSRLLCTEHVTGASMHLSVRVLASPDAPDVIAAHYAGAPGADTTAPRSFAFGDDVRVSVHAPDEPYPGCGVEPSEADRSVVVVSHAMR